MNECEQNTKNKSNTEILDFIERHLLPERDGTASVTRSFGINIEHNGTTITSEEDVWRLIEERDALAVAVTQLQHLNQCATGDDCETCKGISQHALLNGKAQEILHAHDADVRADEREKVLTEILSRMYGEAVATSGPIEPTVDAVCASLFLDRAAERRDERKAIYSECRKIALGCKDYGGGYHSDPKLLEAFHHGMQTVANAIEARAKNPYDKQARAVLNVGEAIEREFQPGKPEQTAADIRLDR